MARQNQKLPTQVSSNHRRVISVRLRQIEEYCVRLLGLFNEEDLVLSERAALPREKAAKVQALVCHLRSRVAQMKEDLGLEKASVNVTREAETLVSMITLDIEELHPRYLRGYGEVPEEVRSYLENHLKELLSVT